MQQRDEEQYIVNMEEMRMLFRYQDLLPILFIGQECPDDAGYNENAVLAGLYQKGYVDFDGDRVVCREPILSVLQLIRKAEVCILCTSWTESMDSYLYYKAGTEGIAVRAEAAAANSALLEFCQGETLKQQLEQFVPEEFRETPEELFEAGSPDNDRILLRFDVCDKQSGKPFCSAVLAENGISDVLILQKGEKTERKRFQLKELTELLGF